MAEIPKDDIQSLYASLMAEVKARLIFVSHEIVRCDKGTDGVEKTFIAENCYLQLRRITELIALAVLAVHNHHPGFRHKDLLKAWNADELLTRITKMSASAFPQPTTFTELDGGKAVSFLPNPKTSSTLRDEVRKIYVECGDKLHTGHLRAMLKQRNKKYDMRFVRRSAERIAGLLENHFIILPDQTVMRAMLDLKSVGPVRCQWLDPSPPQPPE